VRSIHVLYVGRSWCTVRLLVSLMIKSDNCIYYIEDVININNCFNGKMVLERHFGLSFAKQINYIKRLHGF